MVTAIVLSGGAGKRFGGNVKKQYLEACGIPILARTLLAFEKSRTDAVVLVCSAEDMDFCRHNIIEKYNIKKVNTIVSGGSERYFSVFNGLNAIEEGTGDCVLIHDGARPCVSPEIINKCIGVVESGQCCAVGVPVVDTVQIVDDKGIIKETPDRKTVWAAQTPQCFPLSVAKKAYELAISADDSTITDDAMVVRKYAGKPVKMIMGSRENVKLTTEEDLYVIERYFSELDKER